VIADLAYREVEGWRGTIDLHLPGGPGPHPAVLYLHGGGWRMGSKASGARHASEWLGMGLAVAAASYRLVQTAPAPAAAEDVHAALDWLREHGAAHRLDAERIVVCGHSAGGLLALAAGWRHEPAPAAIVAWSAHCDLAGFHAGRMAEGDPVEWLAQSDDPAGLALALSPLHMVRPGLPPTLLIHSDRDPRIPYASAVRLTAALTEAGIAAELVTMRSNGHLTQDQPPTEVARGHEATRAFLARHGVLAEA
jgi:acetyl esterase/lipase